MTGTNVHRRFRRRASVAGWVVLLLSVAALVATSCTPSAGPEQGATEEARDTFSVRRESENGASVALEGYAEGYEPGAQATFDLTIDNQSERPWPGRFCLQLMDDEQPRVVATLEQRPFDLEPGLGFTDAIDVELPEGLDDGAYGVALVVRSPDGPTVNLVTIEVGESGDEREATTQEEMDAALEACPAVGGAASGVEELVGLAKEDLVERAGVSVDEIVVESIEEVDFEDASLGVPEPGTSYAQVITPGYVIRLEADGKTYEYHAAGERVVLAVEA